MKKRKQKEEIVEVPIETEPEDMFLSCGHGEEPAAPAPAAEDMAYIRLKADFENLKKRQEAEIGKEVGRRLRDFFGKFLRIYDDLGRALASVGEIGQNAEGFYEGIKLIYKHMEDLLQQQGVKRIEAVGFPFDPVYHEAVVMEAAQDVPENTVIEELETGYLFQGTLIRPARVKVAKGS